jgi:hypothetical protein
MLHANCQFAKDNAGVAWNSTASPFKGEKREMYVNQNGITNARGPNAWYCDPYGGNAGPQPFPGSIRQYIAPIDYNKKEESLVFGEDTNHGGPGVRSPN